MDLPHKAHSLKRRVLPMGMSKSGANTAIQREIRELAFRSAHRGAEAGARPSRRGDTRGDRKG